MMRKIEAIEPNLAEMISLVEMLGNINTHFENTRGIDSALSILESHFTLLKPDLMHRIDFPKTQGLFLEKRTAAPLQIYLGGHLDTVFSLHSPFQKVERIDAHTLRGPGITDMKGGLIVLLKTLEILESKATPSSFGWRVFVNTDEEIGSIYSAAFIQRYCLGCRLGCIFEPTLPDGSFVSERKGSQNYLLTSHGVGGHAGRDAGKGKNAIFPLTRMISGIECLHQPDQGILINPGLIKGGQGKNIIPDQAECHLNVRTDTTEQMEEVDVFLLKQAEQEGILIKKESYRPPKPLDHQTEELLGILQQCGKQLGTHIKWNKSGGVCDGNLLAASGVPTLDTMGVEGGGIHTEKEYMKVESLSEKTKLAVLFISRIVP